MCLFLTKRWGLIIKTLPAVLIIFLFSCNSSKPTRNYTKNHAYSSERSNAIRPSSNNVYSNSSRSNSTNNSRRNSSENIAKKRTTNSSETKEKIDNSTSSTSSQRYTIVKSAKKHLGKPYKYGGSTPSAFDCSG